MTPNIPFPKYTFEFITETYTSKISRRSQVIYIVFILAILIIGCCLPFFTINISVKSLAFIRPASEISAIRSLVNGKVKQSDIIENKSITKNETLSWRVFMTGAICLHSTRYNQALIFLKS